MRKRLAILIAVAALLVAGALLLRGSEGVSALLWDISDGGAWLLPLLVVSALIDSINPCAFSVLLVSVLFLIGLGVTRSRLLAVGGAYIAGIFGVYLLIGLGIVQALHLFDTPHFMAKVGAGLLVALGAINLIGEFFPAFPIKLRIPQGVHHAMAKLMNRTSLAAALGLGALVGLCEFPCTGGPYLMVLGLLHDQQTYAAGFGYLVLYNLIFILPLVVMLFIASEPTVAARVQAWQRGERKAMRLAAGVAMVALGALIFFL